MTRRRARDLDVEVYDAEWRMFWRDKQIASGTYRTMAGLYATLWWQFIKFRLGVGEPARIVRSMR